jgi:hypothetical protein
MKPMNAVSSYFIVPNKQQQCGVAGSRKVYLFRR